MTLAAIKDRSLLWIALILFIIAKLPHLHYAFYWDESWVYAPAIYLMYAHGPSIMPDAIPIDYSRGHPLLFHAACAAWMNLFGKSHVSMHCFALFIAVLLVIAVYEIVLRLFNARAAILSAALLLINNYFFAESSFLLTDISLALFALLSIYYYIKEKHFLTGLFLTLLFYTKESGIVICAVLGIDILLSFFLKKITPKKAIAKSLSLVVPVLIMLAFFIVQKKINGWYLYPGHISAINLDPGNTLADLQDSLSTIFYKEHIYWCYILAGMLFTIAVVKQKKWRSLWAVAYALFFFASVLIFSTRDAVFYLFLAVSVAVLSAFFIKPLSFLNTQQSRFIKLIAAFCLFYILFCCVNFYETRYLIPALFFISVILVGIGTERMLTLHFKKLFYPVLITIVIAGCWNLSIHGAEMDAYTRMDAQQDIVNYFEQNNFYNKHIACKSYFQFQHLADPKTGFLHSEKAFKYVTEEAQPNSELFIFDNLEPIIPGMSKEEKNNTLQLIHRFSRGDEWVEVYKRK